MRNLIVIEFPSNLGLQKMASAEEPGVSKFPATLKKLGFYTALGADKVISVPAPAYSTQIDPVTQVRNARSIIRYAHSQADIIEKEINENAFLLLIGGDCSILIGTALGLKRKGRYGLFYLDGHTDYMMPALSHTHGAAGMDLAIVTGLGHPDLTNIDDLCPYFKKETVFCVGNRCYDPEYEKPIKNSGIPYFPLKEFRKEGIENVVKQFFGMLAAQKLDGFFIHFDVDVLEDSLMPAVDSRQPDGLTYLELQQILNLLLSHPQCSGMEITIFDPDLDPEQTYVTDLTRHLIPVINKNFSR